MKSNRVILAAGFSALVVVAVSVCGALGLLADKESGVSGAAEGALIGLSVAVVLLVVRGVRIMFSRSPEADGPEHDPNSVERYFLKEAASAAFADTLILLILVTFAGFSLLRDASTGLVLAAVLLVAAGDLAVRLVVLRKRGV